MPAHRRAGATRSRTSHRTPPHTVQHLLTSPRPARRPAQEYLGTVDRVELNREIGRIEATGNGANDLRDQREEALRQLAEQIEFDYQEDDNGAVRVLVDGRLLVGPTSSNELTAFQISPGEVELRLEAPEGWVNTPQTGG